jgi:hypothetical protein
VKSVPPIAASVAITRRIRRRCIAGMAGKVSVLKSMVLSMDSIKLKERQDSVKDYREGVIYELLETFNSDGVTFQFILKHSKWSRVIIQHILRSLIEKKLVERYISIRDTRVYLYRVIKK